MSRFAKRDGKRKKPIEWDKRTPGDEWEQQQQAGHYMAASVEV